MPPKNKNWRDLGLLLNLGWVIALALSAGSLGGHYLDKHYNTSPIFILIGVFLGFAVAGLSLYNAVKRLDRQEK